MSEKKSQWYDVDKTLSNNCLLNFVVGQRGVGKTYAAKKRVIKNYLNKYEQFVYLRRYETELKTGQIELFFADIQKEFPDCEFLVQKGKFYINGEVAGYYMPLSKAAQFKSVPYPKVSMIIFDEFIIDQGLIRYLPEEVTTFNEMYSTIARLRDVRVLFLSNAITFTNPYFIFFNLSLQQGQTIVKKGDILLELVNNEVYTEKAKQTRFGKIISDTAYGKYAIENQFLRDTDSFIEKMNEAGRALILLKIDNIEFCVYSVMSTYNWYVSEKIDRSVKVHISLDVKSHDNTTVYAKEEDAMIWYMQLKQKYYRAELRFTSMKAKNMVSEALRKSN